MRRTTSQSKEKPSEVCQMKLSEVRQMKPSEVRQMKPSEVRQMKPNEVRQSDCHWEELMRKFSADRKRRDRCKSLNLDLNCQQRPLQQFCTGSSYEGTWDNLGMNGYGTYTFSNGSGVKYEGEFEDGDFHGFGVLRYPSGITVSGQWVKGELVEKTIVFADDVQHRDDDWKYTQQPDRRFSVEYSKGLKPAGGSVLTADQPTKPIPEGCYDTGDGFYDSKTKVVFSYDMTSVLRSPEDRERKWIEANCRTNPAKPVGPCSYLYEEWNDPKLELSNQGTESPSESHNGYADSGQRLSIPSRYATTTGIYGRPFNQFDSYSYLQDRSK